ncbi:MAG TPA: LysE family translocator [Tepidisphaeraceae bacterium]|jgi:threonine/homoserine/homoserine lactone efflux protein
MLCAAVFGTHDLPLFLLSGVLLNLTPGQDTMYILGRGVTGGRRAGVISALGISCGCLVHCVAAACGLSAILVASSTAYEAVKWAGAAYLIYLGVRLLLTAPSAVADGRSAAGEGDREWVIFRQAVLTNVLNPKVALFFLAFLPQFVRADAAAAGAAQRAVAFLFLGACFAFTGTCWCLVLGYAAGTMSRTMHRRRRLMRFAERAAGGLFIALGLRLAVSRR